MPVSRHSPYTGDRAEPPEQLVDVPGVGRGRRLPLHDCPTVVVLPLGSPDAVLLVLSPDVAERVPDLVGAGRAVVLADPAVGAVALARVVAAASVVAEHGEPPTDRTAPAAPVPAPRTRGVGKRRGSGIVGPLLLTAACVAPLAAPGSASAMQASVDEPPVAAMWEAVGR